MLTGTVKGTGTVSVRKTSDGKFAVYVVSDSPVPVTYNTAVLDSAEEATAVWSSEMATLRYMRKYCDVGRAWS